MTTVKAIFDFINTVAPPHMKESWDNVGLNCGRMDKEVKTVLVALDPFMHVCKEAVDIGADLLVTHHALIWQPGFITDQTTQGRNVLFLIEHGIPCINAHTNLDCAPGGVNDVLAQTLGLQDISVIAPNGVDEGGRPWGLLRQGTVEKQALPCFLEHVKNALGCKGLKFVDGGKAVHKVAVGGGSCAGALMDVARAGCDTFVTADIKYNQYWDAKELGISLIDAGHFHTENPVCAVLAVKLQAAFPEVKVIISQNHTDCANFFC